MPPLLHLLVAYTQAAAAFAPLPFGERAPRECVVAFTRPVKDVTAGYGKMAYQATAPGWKAEVTGGRLRLRGDHEMGDQRLFITAQKALGRKAWPDALEVKVKLGGTGEGSGLWHVGVSVGSVKVLFHPGHDGGALRAETVHDHKEFFANEDMGLTPAPDVMHDLTLKVRRAGPNYRFEVELVDGKSRKAYRKTFQVAAKQVGEFGRVGLERSGFRGGDALFESLSIRPLK